MPLFSDTSPSSGGRYCSGSLLDQLCSIKWTHFSARHPSASLISVMPQTSLYVSFLPRKSLLSLLTSCCDFYPIGFCPRGRLLIYINILEEDFDSHKDFSSWCLLGSRRRGVQMSWSRWLSVGVPGDISSSCSELPKLETTAGRCPHMSQCGHRLVELVSLLEAPARRAEQTQRQAYSGTSHSASWGAPERHWCLSRKECFVVSCPPKSSSCLVALSL